MSELPLPGYPPGERPSTSDILQGILDYDQFDDWFPDPVYYEDARTDPQHVIDRVERAWSVRRLIVAPTATVEIPRDGGDGFFALSLPLDARCCTHAAVAAMAPRIAGALQRDKVYGFEFNPRTVPFFTEPGVGLKDAMDAALIAALVSGDDLYVFDVVAFNRSLRFDSLVRTLVRNGARLEEIELLRTVTSIDQPGLPSIDDSLAFIYNFYLEPVDRALMAGGVNVFRYRDEYFVPGIAGQAALTAHLGELGLTARAAATFSKIDREGDLKSQATPERSSVQALIGEFGAGEVAAVYGCQTWESRKVCATDQYEVVYRERGLPALADLFALPPARVYDGVRVLPFVRLIHQHRRTGVFFQPPFTAVPLAFEQYQQAAGKGRAWLLRALDAAVSSKSTWQVTWTAAALSDLGTLRAPEIAILQDAGSLPGEAGLSARLALARSSTVSVDKAWRPPTGSGSQERRAALLAAYHLAGRGIWRPLTTMKQQASATEPALMQRIEAHLRSRI